MSAPRWSLDGVPDRPGVYLFRDAEGRVLYVGKARDLRARLSSYRRPGGDGRLGVLFLERDAAGVETIVTRTEGEALLLEDALVKQHKPPHNVRLKDDKSFLMIRLDPDQEFPRLEFVRQHRPKAAKEGGRARLFGPYPSARAVRRTMTDLHRVVPLRDCTDTTLYNRTRPCLRHQIGLCAAPCVGLVGAPEYAALVGKAVDVLSGDTAELERDLAERMEAASDELEYERAAHWRDRLAALRRTVEGQGVTPRDKIDRDVLALARRGDAAVVHRLAFRDGRLTESKSHAFRSELPDDELLHVVLTAVYAPGRRRAPGEIVLPLPPAEAALLEGVLGDLVRFVAPLTGERRRMLDIARANANAELERREGEDAELERALVELARLVDLDPESPPEVIDCFDVSTIQGKSTVASRVRFRGGAPDRSGYRRFKVRLVEGQDDFAAMEEVVGRSLKRCVADGELPDLIVVDGGEQQLARALQARADAGADRVPIVGLAKARSERTVGGRRKAASEERLVLSPDGPVIELARHSPARHLLERLRDEAHRFAITFHRAQRGRLTSQLDSIPGIGDARRKVLLRTFGSVAGVREASIEQLAALPSIGPELAQVIHEHLRR